eukprot:1089630-Pleurochrysis_carterae.AAC.1
MPPQLHKRRTKGKLHDLALLDTRCVLRSESRLDNLEHTLPNSPIILRDIHTDSPNVKEDHSHRLKDDEFVTTPIYPSPARLRARRSAVAAAAPRAS